MSSRVVGGEGGNDHAEQMQMIEIISTIIARATYIRVYMYVGLTPNALPLRWLSGLLN